MIVFENVQKSFKGQVVLQDINFEIKTGEIFVLLGASGCGKTTCLKMINRLEKATNGRILFKGEDIQKKDLIPYRRNIGYVLQSTGLFPHMTVKQNLSLLQEIEHIPKNVIEKTNMGLMEMVGMDPEMYLDRFPYQLSGGQKQRIGVARAFALNPEVILMDEPFSAVDPLVRLALQDELLKIQKKMNKTIVFVTHDIGEAFRIGDTICLFEGHSIAQCGKPDELLNHPSSEYVKTFIGKATSETNIRQMAITAMINRDIIIAKPEDKIDSLKVQLGDCRERKIVVVNNKKIPIGMASYTRVMGITQENLKICDVMWTHFEPVVQNESMDEAIMRMNQYGVSYLPVVDGSNEVIGTIAAIDILELLK